MIGSVSNEELCLFVNYWPGITRCQTFLQRNIQSGVLDLEHEHAGEQDPNHLWHGHGEAHARYDEQVVMDEADQSVNAPYVVDHVIPIDVLQECSERKSVSRRKNGFFVKRYVHVTHSKPPHQHTPQCTVLEFIRNRLQSMENNHGLSHRNLTSC